MRLHIIGNVLIKSVGKYESCMVSKLPIIFKRTRMCAHSAGGAKVHHHSRRLGSALQLKGSTVVQITCAYQPLQTLERALSSQGLISKWESASARKGWLEVALRG